MSTFFEEVVAASEKSHQSSTFYSPGSFYLEPVNGVFGRDSGADYACYIVEQLKQHILEEAQSKRLHVSIRPLVAGPSARDGFADKIKELLSEFDIEWRGPSLEIRWPMKA